MGDAAATGAAAAPMLVPGTRGHKDGDGDEDEDDDDDLSELGDGDEDEDSGDDEEARNTRSPTVAAWAGDDKESLPFLPASGVGDDGVDARRDFMSYQAQGPHV